MAGYTIRNIEDLEDMAPKFDLGEVQEARFATKPLECEQTGLLHLRVKPNQTSPFAHHHAQQEELYVVLDGSGQLLLGDEVRDVTAGDVIRISPEVVRSVRTGDEALTLLAFGAPAVSGGENDAEMAPAEWPD
jgi:mannose-6-phosphate isomerase-like protein (cupin superfamily)